MSGPTSPRDQRVDAVIPVRFADAKEFLVEYTSNISLGGVFVRTASPSAFGTVVRLSLELPGTSQAVPVTGQVAFVLPADQAARQGKVPGMGVRFARLDSAVQETLAAYVETLQKKSRGRVLLVDDDAVSTQKLADLLRGYHLNVITVSSAIKALEILRFGGVDFVISDIVMPRMDGFEFRDNVRNNPKMAGIPFAFLTSSESPADMQLAAELGVQYFLRKPVEPGPLLGLLRQVLGDGAFQPDAPGTPPALTEEKIQRKRVQDRRIIEIAYRKFVALGMDTRFTADERGVYGQLSFKTVTLQDPATGARIERVGLYSVGHDRVKPFWPRALGALPMFNLLDLPDAPSLERMISAAYARRIDTVRQVKQLLDSFRVPNRYDAGGMRMLGQIKSGTDEIVFSVRDQKTLFLETLNGRSFGEVAGMRARLVDIGDAKGGVDVEIALETAFRRLQQSMQSGTGPAPATTIGADGRRQAAVIADLSEDPDNAALLLESAPAPGASAAPAAPVTPPPPEPPPKPAGEWIGESEDGDQAIAAAAVDMATKAAIAASVAAVSSPAPVEEAPPPPADDVWPAAEASPPADATSPFAEPPAPEPEAASPFAESEASAPYLEATAEPEPASVEATGELVPAPADASAEPYQEPEPSAAPAEGSDDWSAYATPDAAAAIEPQPETPGPADFPVPPAALTDRDTAPGVQPESLQGGAAFAGEEYELPAGTSGDAELELATSDAPASAEPAWSARDAEAAPADLAAAAPEMAEPAPEVAEPPPAPEPDPVAVQTDFSHVTDMDATLVPRSEPEVPLSPEEANARKWADEWTGDESTAEPLWTIQPGEEKIKASPMVTDALETRPASSGTSDAPPPAAAPAAAAASPAAASTDTTGMTAMVCTQCNSTYYIGDEIEDERLLLMCPSCIEKNPAS